MKSILIVLLIVSANGLYAQEWTERATIESTMKAVEILSKADRRCEQESDCVSIPLGSRACGGPEKYIVASKLNANFDFIQNLALRSETLESAFNSRYGTISICSMAMQKDPQCVANNCL